MADFDKRADQLIRIYETIQSYGISLGYTESLKEESIPLYMKQDNTNQDIQRHYADMRELLSKFDNEDEVLEALEVIDDEDDRERLYAIWEEVQEEEDF
jgi:hypothetical protein